MPGLRRRRSRILLKCCWILLRLKTGGITIITESMNEENMVRFLSLPFAMVGSDGSPSQGRPHPRLYGTFPRVIRRVVRELGALSMEAAVHKMSGLTARRLGLERHRNSAQRFQSGCRAL